jgi:hypothetical protein
MIRPVVCSTLHNHSSDCDRDLCNKVLYIPSFVAHWTLVSEMMIQSVVCYTHTMVCVTRCSTFRRLLHTHIHILNDTLNTCVRDDDTIRRLLHTLSQGVIQSVVCCMRARINNVTRRDPIRRLLHAYPHGTDTERDMNSRIDEDQECEIQSSP